jgi:hypothetical protein
VVRIDKKFKRTDCRKIEETGDFSSIGPYKTKNLRRRRRRVPGRRLMLHLLYSYYRRNNQPSMAYNFSVKRSNILWHADPLLGNDYKISNYTTAIAK